jgi:hypothetical protein
MECLWGKRGERAAGDASSAGSRGLTPYHETNCNIVSMSKGQHSTGAVCAARGSREAGVLDEGVTLLILSAYNDVAG